MRVRVWVGLLLCVLAVMPARAQETRGNISGTVRDAQGIVPGATVRVVNINTNVTQTLVTNSRGYYEAPLLNPGDYRVEVEMQGFKKSARDGISLGVGQSLTADFTLEPRRPGGGRRSAWPRRDPPGRRIDHLARRNPKPAS
jgi:hypothetical protein